MKHQLLILLLLLTGAAFASTEVYFSPSADCENRIVKAIDESQREIAVAIYSINNVKICDALIKAKLRGVKVRILTDAVQASSPSSKALHLVNSGLDLRLNSKFKIEHNKFAIYDGATFSTGSFNWTGAASRSNSENCIFSDEKNVIAKYSERFEFLWSINTADGSKSRVQKIVQSAGADKQREPQLKGNAK